MKSIPVRFYSLHLRSGEDVLDYQIFLTVCAALWE